MDREIVPGDLVRFSQDPNGEVRWNEDLENMVGLVIGVDSTDYMTVDVMVEGTVWRGISTLHMLEVLSEGRRSSQDSQG